MADPQYTDAQLSDGTILRFNGQLNPKEVATKVAAFRSKQTPAQPHGAGSGWEPESDAPDPRQAKIGSHVPEFLTPALSWAQQHYVEPMEKYVGAVGSAGRELGRETLGMGSDPNVQKKYGMEKSVPLHTALGVTGAVGSVAATTALDPRNWPLMASSAARPALQRLMAAGFAGQMGKGSYDAATQLYQNWDKLSPEQRAELGTNAGISALMAAASGHHAVRGAEAPVEAPKPAPPEVIKQVVQAKATSSPGPVEHTQAPEISPEEEKASVQKLMELRKSALPQVPLREMPANVEAVWQASAFGEKPVEDVGTKVRSSMPSIPRGSKATSPEPTPNAKSAALLSNETTGDRSPLAKSGPDPKLAPVTDPGEGFNMPKQGEVVDETYKRYPSKEEMRFRMFKKLEYTQRELQDAVASKDQAKIDAAQKRVVGDALTWAQYATPDDITQAMQRLHNNTSLLGEQINRMKDLNQGLLGGKLSFYESKESQQIDRADFRQVVGSDLPKVPKDFVENLPQEVKGAIPEKGRERKELIGRLWAARFLQEQGAARLEEFNRAYELQAAIAQAKGIKNPPKESFFLAKNVPATKAPISPEVGREAQAPAEAVSTQPAQAASATAGPREPVRATEGPEVRTPFSAEAKIDTEAERLKQVATPKADTNWFALAQEDLRGKLGKEPSISEVAQHAAILKGKFLGVEDPQLESRIQTLVKRGMARGSAERMARDQLAKERSDEQIREQQEARPGERGSLSFRRLQPQIGPLGPPPAHKLATFLDRVATLGGATERSGEETQARDITRKYAAGLALDHLRLEAKLKDAISRHDADGADEFRAFMDAGEGKIAQGPVNWNQVGPNSPHPQAPFMSVEDVGTAQLLHQEFQNRWQKVQQILDKEPGGIENYLAHLWKQPGFAKKTMNAFFGRRPIEGKKIFLKQRFYDYASDGLDHGLEPITYNPIRMQLTALFQMDKFLAAHELKDMYQDAGLIRWTKLGDKSTPDWVSLNDKIFQPKVMQDGGLTEYGQYKAPADVAKIFNRYVAPGLRGNATYDAIRQYGNFLNQINLGVSAYHGIFTTLTASSSDVALGLEKVFNRGEVGGLKDIFRGTMGTFLAQSAIRDYQLGGKIQSEAINPTGNAHLQAYVDSLVQSGARFAQDPMYENPTGKQVLNSLKSGNLFDAAKGGVQNFPVTKFIMQKWVPRIKLGMAAQMMDHRLRYLIDQGTTDPVTIANEMGKIWDSVDNRAGQMVYDNLFWNKAAKDISFLGVRAVGWDYGSMREGLGAGKDVLQQAAKALRGERPEMTHRMAFVAGTVATVATLGAVTTYLATGKPPQKLEDYFYPYSGRMGPNGKPERMSYPSYMKDAFAIAHDVKNLKADTVLHKAHPMINQVAEFLQNKDFYNTEIRSEGDPWYAQAWQVGKWYGKSFLPFSATMASQRAQSGIPPAEAYGESFFGLQKAPAYVTNTPAEEMTLDFAKRNWKAGPLSSREREQRDTYNHFKTQVALGKLDTRELSQAFTQGKLREHDLDRLFDDQGLSSFQQEFKSLKLPEALKVMKVASSEERQQLKPLLIDKIDQLDNFPVPEEQAFYQGQIQKYLQ